jgi:protein gp37
MSDQSHIQWTDATWNTVSGCTRVSPGCERCYIDRTPPFRMNGRKFDKPEIGGTTGVILHDDRLTLPLTWRKPRRVFVNSLSDLFHEGVPASHIAKVFAVMAATPQHTYQILTKRPARMRSLLRDECRCGAGHQPSVHFRSAMSWAVSKANGDGVPGPSERQVYHEAGWPLPNVWLGVSTEDQQWAEARIPLLLETPAAVRFISAEPLLGPIDLRNLKARGAVMDALGGDVKTLDGEVYTGTPSVLDWVIIGGESGPGARPMDTLWAMDLVIQCSARRLPMFVKQLGSVWARENGAADRKGGDPAEWPKGLQERHFPRVREAVSV